MFPSLPTSGSTVAGTNFLVPRKQKWFQTNSRNFLRFLLSYVSNVSSTRNIDFTIKNAQVCNKRSFGANGANKNHEKCRFPSLPTLGNIMKHYLTFMKHLWVQS